MTAEAPAESKDAPRYGRITDEELDKLRNRMFKVRPIAIPYNRAANLDAINHYARGIGDMNPLYLDEDYAKQTRWGGVIAPPCFLYSVHWGSWDLRRGWGLPGVHGLHCQDRWQFFAPIPAGAAILATRELVGLEEKQGRLAGRAFIETVLVRFHDHAGRLLATVHMSSYRAERDAAKKTQKYGDVDLGHYTSEELGRIEADYDAEIIRGAQTRYWEDVEVGESLQPVVKGPFTSADMIAWVMGVGSPHVRFGQYFLQYRRRTPAVAVLNPETGVPEPVERVHWDNFMAGELGMPAAYDYGSHRGALSSHLMTNWIGDDGWLALHDVQYRGMVFLGDTVWFKGTVTRKFEQDGNSFVDVEIQGVNQRGEAPLRGRAVAALPSRARGPVAIPCAEVA
jgi:acyl dehydratase